MSENPILTAEFFSRSHAQFLEQLSDKDFWSYATQLAHAAPVQPEQCEEYLECEVDGKRCYLALANLSEVMPPPQRFTRLPASPVWMLGVVAWRGETIAVAALDAYLLNRPAHIQPGAMLLIAQIGELTMGLLVSMVGSMKTLEMGKMVAPEQAPAWVASFIPNSADIIKGVYENALMLDIPAFLNDLRQQMTVVSANE